MLRYFNAAGAHRELRVGQSTLNATHLIKVAAEVATGKRDHMNIYGTDYNTPDGTCLRDFVHVEDLVEAHIASLKFLQRESRSEIFNVGYGRLTSVKDIIKKMTEVSGMDIRVRNRARRPGDVERIGADCSKIKRELHWVPKYADLEEICRTAFEWEKKIEKTRD